MMQSGTNLLDVRGNQVRLSYLRRPGSRPPLVCLHGFGSTKEDYADLCFNPDFTDRDLFLLDAPGFGASQTDDPDGLAIPFLVDVVLAACDAQGLSHFHLAGHSMGGLTALLLAHSHPERVLSFIDIEGNVAPEDCFLSRQIVEHRADTPDAFRDGFIERVSQRPEYGSALYAAALSQKVRATSFKPVFSSMVDISDNEPLLDIFANLTCPRTFIYGEQNRHLTYLNQLPDMGVSLVEIPQSGHFPMYSNPPALWAEMAKHLAAAEKST